MAIRMAIIAILAIIRAIIMAMNGNANGHKWQMLMAINGNDNGHTWP